MLHDPRIIQIERLHTGTPATEPAGWNVSPAARALHTWRLWFWVRYDMDKEKTERWWHLPYHRHENMWTEAATRTACIHVKPRRHMTPATVTHPLTNTNTAVYRIPVYCMENLYTGHTLIWVSDLQTADRMFQRLKGKCCLFTRSLYCEIKIYWSLSTQTHLNLNTVSGIIHAHAFTLEQTPATFSSCVIGQFIFPAI